MENRRDVYVAAGPEGEARLKLFSKCPFGQFHMADPDGILIDIAEQMTS